MLFFAGLIGGKVRKSAMETAKMSFGNKGALIFSLINIIQLIGWTSIMIYDGAVAANEIFNIGNWIWCTIIGFLIIFWIVIGIKNLGKVNIVAIALLFVLTIILSIFIFNKDTIGNISCEVMTFGAAVELSVAMPLSWLPLISDYTREAEKPVRSTLVSTITYGLVSIWMYVIGMGAAIFTGESNVSQILIKAGFGMAGLLIIVFSTVTTTFLDAYSAGISSESLSSKINGKYVAIIITFIGILCAIFLPLSDITNFLYFISSVFAPMIAIQIADFFILKQNNETKTFSIQNIIIWLVGFVIYRILMNIDIVVGNTLPDMLITIVLCNIVNRIRSKAKQNNGY